MQTQLLKATTEGIRKAARLLRDGQVVAVPTETVYGLAADALNPQAVAAIFKAKNRPMDNPLIVHIADIKDWEPLVKFIPDTARQLAQAYWPGPLTMILPAADCVPNEVRGGLATVAVRFPSDPIAQAIILHSGCPLAAPSANRSGSPSPTNATRVLEDMQGRIAAIVDGGDSAVGVESTVLDLSGETPRLLRPGGVTPQMIEDIIGEIEIDKAVTNQLEHGAVAASPGMKYKHYAPKARVRLIKGTPSAYVDYVNSKAADGVAALCFDEDVPHLTVPCVTYGHRDDSLEQAHRLFDALRQIDELGAHTVYAACPRPEGVGLAVYNRIIRAAAFDVVNLTRIIGLTGPTGAGKSSVADAWRQAGVPIVDADAVARQVTSPDSPCIKQLVSVFTDAILNPDGSINRKELAQRAFESAEATEKLNRITHPAIMATIRKQLDDLTDSGHPLVVLDAPLLYEAGADTLCDHIVVVTAPKEMRLSRIMKRDAIDREAALLRMNAQPNDEFYQRDGVTVIYNDTTPDALRKEASDFICEQAERRWQDE